MPDAMTLLDTGYSLAEAAILSRPWLSTSTLPDVLARPAVVDIAVEPPAPVLQKVIIRKQGPALRVEIYATGLMSRPFLKCVEGVVDLLGLPPGWNSYSAKPIAARNAVRAIQVLASLMNTETPPPAVVPRVQGGIQLEWHTKEIDIEVYIDSPEKVSFFAEHAKSGENIEEPLASHEHELKVWLQRVAGK
ncbi:MAG: hypothetical protein HY235_10900 [Acidobacteria bacterium]|nr:hypothetical protein [Acidobacteriota bacterium]